MWTKRIACWSVAALLAASAAGEDLAGVPLADLVKRLDAEGFADRQAAGDELLKRGKAAIPTVAEAAGDASAERATRALEILGKQLESSDAGARAAARGALEKLAAGESLSAKRAAEILKSKSQEPAAAQPAPLGPGIRIFGGGGGAGAIRIAVAVGDGAARRVSVKDVEGVKEVEVVEGERTIKINADPTKGIQVQVTEKKDGKDVTKQFEAKDADELKEKHPEAHKLYEQYKNGAAAEIRIEGLPALPAFPALPALPPLPPLPAPPARFAPLLPAIVPNAKEVTDRLDKAQQQLGEAAEKLKKLSENSAEAKAALEAIERSQKELEEVRAKIRTP